MYKEKEKSTFMKRERECVYVCVCVVSCINQVKCKLIITFKWTLFE